MISRADFERLDEQVQQLKRAAQALSDSGDQFPAIKRNAVRILSSIKMMEINVSDVVHLTDLDEVGFTPQMRR